MRTWAFGIFCTIELYPLSQRWSLKVGAGRPPDPLISIITLNGKIANTYTKLTIQKSDFCFLPFAFSLLNGLCG